MIQAAQARKFQVVLCKSQSRFTRDMELVEKYIHGLFPIWGIRFIAVADNADTAVRGNKKARQINGLVNEWYLEDLSENIRMVFDMKRRQGQYIGSFPLYGYRKDPQNKNRLVVDPEAAEVVRQIFQWALEGRGKQNIAFLLNSRGIPNPTRYKAERGLTGNRPAQTAGGLWGKATVRRILCNEMYTGTMVQGRSKKVSYKSKATVSLPREQWFRVAGTHEAIVDPQTFWTVQDLMALRSRGDGTGLVHPLAGLVHCMDCGSTMSKTSNGKKSSRQVFYLRCKLYADSGAEKLCTRHSIRLDRLIDLVLERMRTYIRQFCPPEKLALSFPCPEVRETALVQERTALIHQSEKRSAVLRQLYLDRVSGTLSPEQFAELNEAFLAERVRLENRLSQVDRELAAKRQPQSREAFTTRVRALLALDTLPRELAVSLIQKIEIGEQDPDTGEQTVKIHWKF